MAQVDLDVRSELGKIISELKKIQDQADQAGESIKKATAQVGAEVNTQVKHTETFMDKLQNLGRRTADQLMRDFKALASIKSLQAGLSLSNQFGDSISQTISLSDTIRKLGASFGVARKDFASFQNAMTKGMGEVGMSSEEAASVMKELAGSGVKGLGTIEYAKSAAQLASLGGEQGQGGRVAAGMAAVVRAQGKDVNSPEAMQAVAKAVTKAMEGTGQSATEVLKSMEEVFQSMPAEMRKAVTPEALTGYAAAESVAGPGATAALKTYLQAGQYDPKRLALEAQGFKKVFTKEGGIDVKALKEFANDMKKRGLDFRGSLQTAGFDESEAEGLVRLAENADRVADAMERTATASDDYAKKTRQNMTLQESFNANINKVKGAVADVFGGGGLTQGLSNVLGGASETTAGAIGVTAGGAVLSALLTGGGLQGLGKTIMGQGKREMYEEVTGKTVQDVFVVNASEIGGGAGGALGGMGKYAKGAAGALGVGVAATTGYEIGTAINEHLVKGTEKRVDGMDLNVVERMFHALSKGGSQTKFDPNQAMGFPGRPQEVHVKLGKGLEVTKNSRGTNYGPSTR